MINEKHEIILIIKQLLKIAALLFAEEPIFIYGSHM